jgi:outer membrane lipoprotein-sorting protein
MMRSRSWSSALLLTVGVLFVTGSAAQQAAPAPPPAKAAPAPKAAKRAKKAQTAAPQIVLEPRAIEILKAASAKLAAAKSMAFTAVVSYESPSRLGPPLVYATKSEVTLQRPDKLQIISPGDGPPSEFYYDGKVMMAFAPTGKSGCRRARAADYRRGIASGVRRRRSTFLHDVIVADPQAILRTD